MGAESPASRRAFRERWHTGVTFNSATTVKVPEDVERVYVSEPCFMCGTARGFCRHRVAA